MERFFKYAAGLQGAGLNLCRIGMVIVLLWIGGLKVFKYEANGIMPFVSQSPFMSFLVKSQNQTEYNANKMAEGAYDPQKVEWHKQNNTYIFSYGLGAVICLIGLLIACYPFSPKLSAIGSLLCFLMSFVTLSFLITTPQTWVPDLSNGVAVPEADQNYGFPYLSAAGRLVLKDIIMMGAALVTLAASSEKYLQSRKA